MLGAVDHVGYLARDLEASIERFRSLFGLEIARRIDRPQFDLIGAYLGDGLGSVEIFTFTDAALLAERIGDAELLLDHAAYAVADIAAAATRMRAAGVRFTGPDARGELHEPADLGGVLHLWTDPATSDGQMLQIFQPQS
ncbi:MAG TPA: VOC family protein [Solirubrobacteraceae bacterium]|nr:VOC family protein [Solirubrobacteraceae bacterium]